MNRAFEVEIKETPDGYLLRQTTPKTQTSFTSTLDKAFKLIKKWRTQNE